MILIVDTETTGTDRSVDHLIEVAYARFDEERGLMIDAGSRLVRCAENRAEHINRIPAAMSREFGVESIEAHMGRLAPGARAILAHNAAFDSQWVLTHSSWPWICTREDIDWPNDDQIGSGSLEKLALAFGVAAVPGHRALHDVMTIVRVLEAMAAIDRADRDGRDWHLPWLIDCALEPKKVFRAHVSFDEKEQAKERGFKWWAGPKWWIRLMTERRAAKLAAPFRMTIEDDQAWEQAEEDWRR